VSTDNPALVGIWVLDEGYQITELLFRPAGRYQLDVRSTNPELPYASTERGRYQVSGQTLGLASYDYFGQSEPRQYELQFSDTALTLTSAATGLTQTYQLKADSRADVLARRRVPRPRHLAGRRVGDPCRVRGRYLLAGDKATLQPYPGLGPSRGFELDLYDGDLFLIGDPSRLVIGRKLADSEAGVVDRAADPESMKGERGTILGRWTANMPAASVELVFRPDGEFREARCIDGAVAHDYGLWSVDMAARTLVYDSRFVDVQTLGLDFYGSTLTLFGGLGPPRTFTVNLGAVDEALAASAAADAAEAQVDAAWLARVPVGPRDPNAVQVPTADIPSDPTPGYVFDAPTVLTSFALYRRLLPGVVYFNEWGTIKTVPVVNTREWYLFPTGRALVRFRNHHAGLSYPTTVVDISDSWAAYRVEPRSDQRDILHLYADNRVFIESDVGEQAELTLEDGRRSLFWGKDSQLLSEWASEQQPEPCQPAQPGDPSLINTGLPLTTSLPPDTIPD
jgi:hypothetical protein